jgi:hypothetical protein
MMKVSDNVDVRASRRFVVIRALMLRLIIPAVVMAAAVAAPVAGQQRPTQPRPYLGWHMEVEDADHAFEQTRLYRLYRIRRRIIVNVFAFNDSDVVSSFNGGAFTRRVHVTLEPGSATATNVHWLDADSSIRRLAPSTGVRFRLALETNDEGFKPGDYLIRASLDTENLSDVISMPGFPFRTHGESVARLRIIDPHTPAERVADRLQAGNVVLRKNQLLEAEPLFRSALDLDGNNVEALSKLGGIYLRLARYREAADCLERLPPPDGRGDVVVAPALAQAYIGLGDDGRAMQALTRAGIPTNMIASEFARLKSVVARRQQN